MTLEAISTVSDPAAARLSAVPARHGRPARQGSSRSYTTRWNTTQLDEARGFGLVDPFADHASILACAQVLAPSCPAGEDVVTERVVSVGEPSKQAVTGLFGQFELDRLISLLLDGGRAVTDGAIHDELANLGFDQIAAHELAVDR
jgi:hypothetical protein